MGYFDDLNKAADGLTEKALAMLPDDGKSLSDICESNWKLAWQWFEDVGKEWDAIPDIVANIVDGWLPFGEDLIERNGSLAYQMGLSMWAVEVNARALNDFLKARGSEFEAPLPCVATVEV